MKLIIPTLISVLPLTVGANPVEVAAKIQSSYNPKIEFKKVESSWSLYGCKYEKYEILGKDPVTKKDRKVKVSFYKAKGTNVKSQTVIILPPTGGVNILDKGYANEICLEGINAAIITGWDHDSETSLDFKMHDNGAMRSLAATRHVVEFIKSKDSNQNIGLLGTSIGAVTGALVLGFEPRVSASALIVGSARFADVIVESDEQGAVKLRRERMEILGMKTLEEYRRAVHEAVSIEPIDFISNAKGKPSLTVSAQEDTTVGTHHQYELSSLLQSETHIKIKGNHLLAIKNAFFIHKKKIVKFFAKSL